MAIVKGPWNQDGVDRLSPLISDEYRSHVADKTGITITEFLVKNPFRFKLNIGNFIYTLNPRKDPVVTGGNITSITAFTKSGSSWTPRTSLTKISVSAVSFYQAAMSKSPSDDRQFFESVFKGNDEFNLSDDNDIIRGYAGNDKIYGEAGDDYLDGGIGNDFIDGGTGRDTIIGGIGNDKLIGGANNDLFRFTSSAVSGASGQGTDEIVDFQKGVDKIQIVKSGFKIGTTAISKVVISNSANNTFGAGANFHFNTATNDLFFKGQTTRIADVLGVTSLSASDFSLI